MLAILVFEWFEQSFCATYTSDFRMVHIWIIIKLSFFLRGLVSFHVDKLEPPISLQNA
uniref:Uncharacterized protein n=1 Tax=Aegilops tauschii subsp. strangulata TaxID=200361 RepID=A0A453L067_AEGTS